MHALHIRKLTVLALIALSAAGCGGGSAAKTEGTGAAAVTTTAGTQSAADATITLRVGTDDSSGLPSTDQIAEFARQVQKLSGGAITIESAMHAAGSGDDWDQRVARMVVAGDLEMGLIPSRAWDTEGVTSLRALNAPFLVTSDEVLDQVVAPPVADELMAGLDKAGVVGLALFPEGLRHPFGLSKPLLGPADYEGQTIRSPTSDTIASMFRLLGAKVDQAEPDVAVHAAMESSYLIDVNGTATGNVSFFPKVNALVINPKALQGLSEQQRAILREAAAQTRAWAISKTPTDAAAAKAYCDGGGSIVLAPAADVAALEQATAPLYDELERDPATKQLIAQIRAVKATATAPAPVEACGEPRGSAAPTAATGAVSQLNGVYEYEVTDADLDAHGVTDPATLAENHGNFTWTFTDGSWCWKQTAPNPIEQADDCGTYTVDGNRLVLNVSTGSVERYTWRLTEDGSLALAADGPLDPPIAANIERAWKRTGDAP